MTGTSPISIPAARAKRPRGSTSNRPGITPSWVATLRCSCVASFARARSLASPAPAEAPRTAAAGSAAVPASSAGANPRIEPIPSPSLTSTLSGLARRGLTKPATLLITSRADVSLSSPSGVIAPSAAISRVLTAPERGDLRMSVNSEPSSSGAWNVSASSSRRRRSAMLRRASSS